MLVCHCCWVTLKIWSLSFFSAWHQGHCMGGPLTLAYYFFHMKSCPVMCFDTHPVATTGGAFIPWLGSWVQWCDPKVLVFEVPYCFATGLSNASQIAYLGCSLFWITIARYHGSNSNLDATCLHRVRLIWLLANRSALIFSHALHDKMVWWCPAWWPLT